jgi:hypothetical protein
MPVQDHERPTPRVLSSAGEQTMTPTQTAYRQPEKVARMPNDRLKAFIATPYRKGEIALPTQTERRQDKESAQFPEDEVKEPIFTRTPDDETPEAAALFSITPHPGELCDGAREDDEPTQTGHRQDADSLQTPVDVREDPAAGRHAALEALGAPVQAKPGLAPDPAPETQTTQTGRRQNQQKSILTDEVKAFIVNGLARYETPSRVAASVQAEFGIAVDRRQVFAYDPAGSRSPAQRWIDLHAATRAKFLRAVSQIGVAQKVVRLRMLDRLANRADEADQTERVAKLLEQAAKECGGFYERYARPKLAAPVFATP